jgi:conjugal transfer/entry exclusion protein
MDNNTYNEIIASLDRIIAMQDGMIEKMNEMEGKMNNMIDEISSEKINNDAVVSMREKWTGMRDKFKTYEWWYKIK